MEKKRGLFSQLKGIIVGSVETKHEDTVKKKVANDGGMYGKLKEENNSLFGKITKFITFWYKDGEA